MKKKLNKEKIWMIVLIAAAIVFLVVGVVKIAEANYLMVGTSLISTIVFLWIGMKFYYRKLNFDRPNDGLNTFLPIGFAFTIVGGSGFINAGIWGFGLTLMLIALLFSPKQDETLEEEQNAG